MDSEDERTLHPLWKEMDDEICEAVEKIAWRYVDKIDHLCAERLGYRQQDPADRLDRFECLCGFIERVYLKPSLQLCSNS